MAVTPSPSPSSMPRRQIPTRNGELRYFQPDPPPQRGSDSASAILDTGIMIGLGARLQFLRQFESEYRDRLVLSEIVASEISRLSRGPDAAVAEALRRSAATLISQGTAEVVKLLAEDLDLNDELAVQLRRMAGAPEGASPWNHAGEASSIAIALRLKAAGRDLVFCTNDKSAQMLAASRGITAINFASLIRQSVCRNGIAADQALDIFTRGNSLSSVAARDVATAAQDFACRAVDGQCVTCNWAG